MRALLDTTDANVNCATVHGMTPLHYAATHEHAAVVELLLSRGADVWAKNAAGRTPSDFAPVGSETAALLSNAMVLQPTASVQASSDPAALVAYALFVVPE